MAMLGKGFVVIFVFLLVLFGGFSSVSAYTSPAKIVSGLMSNGLSRGMKWVWSLKATTKTAISGRSMMKFESGYTVETVFDGSKLGIEPYTVEMLPSGELLILDSSNSNIYRISAALSQYSRPRLVAGSPEGYSGHIDGKHREARMNHPKAIAVDDRGNIYVADTANMAIRKITDAGVTTIAGGKWSRGGGHVDGPSEEAKFSNDFDVVYIGSSCSLLVIDRGSKAIREIQLHFDDCAYQYESSFPLGIAVLLAAGFFGYMLALLQRRVGSIVSSQNGTEPAETTFVSPAYQKHPKPGWPPLIPTEEETEKQEEGFFGSLGKLLTNTATSALEIVGSVFPGLKKKKITYQYPSPTHYQRPNTWQPQESFEVPKEDQPPSIETRTPTPKKTYPFMSKDAKQMQQQLRQSRVFYTGWDGDFPQQKHQHRHQQHSSVPKTYYEESSDKTNEIVFGAVQEEGRRESVIKPTDYAVDSSINQQNFRYRMGYTRGY